jgi:hypothetical protein
MGMNDRSHVTSDASPFGGHLARLININMLLPEMKFSSPKRRQLKQEQINLIDQLTRDVYSLRELSRAVHKYETWACTTLRDWRKAQDRAWGQERRQEWVAVAQICGTATETH